LEIKTLSQLGKGGGVETADARDAQSL